MIPKMRVWYKTKSIIITWGTQLQNRIINILNIVVAERDNAIAAADANESVANGGVLAAQANVLPANPAAAVANANNGKYKKFWDTVKFSNLS